MRIKKMRKNVGVLCATILCGAMLFTGCSSGSTAKNENKPMYKATFSVSTSETFDINIDEKSGYVMNVDTDSFTVCSKDSKVSTDVTGVFLDKKVMNQTQAKFHEDASYKEITVDGQTGYSFEAQNKDKIKTYVHVIPCDGSDATYLELFSTISEKDLTAVEKTLHVEKSDK